MYYAIILVTLSKKTTSKHRSLRIDKRISKLIYRFIAGFIEARLRIAELISKVLLISGQQIRY